LHEVYIKVERLIFSNTMQSNWLALTEVVIGH